MRGMDRQFIVVEREVALQECKEKLCAEDGGGGEFFRTTNNLELQRADLRGLVNTSRANLEGSAKLHCAAFSAPNPSTH